MVLRLILALSLAACARPALAVEAHYEAYAAGFNVIDMDAAFDVGAEQYRVRLTFQTVGALGLVARSRMTSEVDGTFVAGQAVPRRYFSSGVMRGETRVTQMEYQAGQPLIRQLGPANETEREPVPPPQQADTIDSLSAMAALVHRVNTTGRCDGRVTTFDGRRLSVLEARTEGPQPLDPSGRSSFSGMTLRCAFAGHQVGGFRRDEDRAEQARTQSGTAWFAAVTPGGPLIPVRIAFSTKGVGEATMYLKNAP